MNIHSRLIHLTAVFFEGIDIPYKLECNQAV